MRFKTIVNIQISFLISFYMFIKIYSNNIILTCWPNVHTGVVYWEFTDIVETTLKSLWRKRIHNLTNNVLPKMWKVCVLWAGKKKTTALKKPVCVCPSACVHLGENQATTTGETVTLRADDVTHRKCSEGEHMHQTNEQTANVPKSPLSILTPFFSCLYTFSLNLFLCFLSNCTFRQMLKVCILCSVHTTFFHHLFFIICSFDFSIQWAFQIQQSYKDCAQT